MLSAREREHHSGYREVDTYRGAAEICDTTHKTVQRIIERAEAGQARPAPQRTRSFEPVTKLVAKRVEASVGRTEPAVTEAVRAWRREVRRRVGASGGGRTRMSADGRVRRVGHYAGEIFGSSLGRRGRSPCRT